MVLVTKTRLVSGVCLKTVVLVLLLLATGCVNGPIRYKTLGFRKYAIVEMFKRSPLALKPLAGATGVVVDSSVLVVETVAAPLTTIYYFTPVLLFEYEGGLANAIIKEPWMLPLGVIACTYWHVLYITAMPYFGQVQYSNMFGVETGIFGERKCDKSSGPPDKSHATDRQQFEDTD